MAAAETLRKLGAQRRRDLAAARAAGRRRLHGARPTRKARASTQPWLRDARRRVRRGDAPAPGRRQPPARDRVSPGDTRARVLIARQVLGRSDARRSPARAHAAGTRAPHRGRPGSGREQAGRRPAFLQPPLVHDAVQPRRHAGDLRAVRLRGHGPADRPAARRPTLRRRHRAARRVRLRTGNGVARAPSARLIPRAPCASSRGTSAPAAVSVPAPSPASSSGGRPTSSCCRSSARPHRAASSPPRSRREASLTRSRRQFRRTPGVNALLLASRWPYAASGSAPAPLKPDAGSQPPSTGRCRS